MAASLLVLVCDPFSVHGLRHILQPHAGESDLTTGSTLHSVNLKATME